MTILITGASGFIGGHLLQKLVEHGADVRSAVRVPSHDTPNPVVVGEVDGRTDWRQALDGIETVIHLAGRAHVLNETSVDPLTEFRRVNTQGTIRLAEQMIEYGCRRLVFVSTIGVNGDTTLIDAPFTEASSPSPQLPYAVAKWEAEQGLATLKDQLEIVIVRPPLVYGPDAPGNFGRLVRLIRRRFPLPLGAVQNLRSLIAVQNLCDLLIRCAEHPAAAGETFVISDGQDLSTPELLKQIARAIDEPIRLIPIPQNFLRLPLRLIGRERILNQLFGSLVVDSRKARDMLDWTAPLTVDQALALLDEGTQ